MNERDPKQALPADADGHETPVKWVSDRTIDHLRHSADWPELGSTRYRVTEPLARGGMGSVYLAQDRELDREVAIKVLHSAFVPTEVAERMRREARVIARLEHPGIVPVHEVGQTPDGRIFYVMKLVRGRRLDELARESTPLGDRLRTFERICETIAFAHANGVIHRDLKPENIMIGSFGEVLVMDWGLAKLLRESEPLESPIAPEETPAIAPRNDTPATAHGTVLGTPAYMAPEQRRGRIELIDERTDVFALGAILRFLLTSACLPQTEQDRERAREPAHGFPVPRALSAICEKAMREERDHRYTSAAEVGAEVARYLDGLAVAAHREGVLEKAWRLLKKHRVSILLILAYLLMRTILVFFSSS